MKPQHVLQHPVQALREGRHASQHYRAELSEIAMVAIDSFRQNRVRFVLTSLGMVIGTASLILVVTIGLTGKHYALAQIQSIGSNVIWMEYKGEGQRATPVVSDFLTVDDMTAVQEQVPGVRAASPVANLNERMPLGGGKEGDANILGVMPDYRFVRNLKVPAGRFFDADDSRQKVALITEKFANQLYGSQSAAVGQTIKISQLPFTIIGTFRESLDTYGNSEVTDYTVLIPYTISKYFTGNNNVKQLYFSMADASMVEQGSKDIQRVITSRHRPESTYEVGNLTEILKTVGVIANIMTIVLMLVSTVVLIVAGVGIMNIMLVTVKSRTREIGIRKAVGATRNEIRFQFLAESVFISLTGGFIGIVIGMMLPISIRIFTEYHIPISGISIIVAVLVSSLVGIVFGTVPASRAAQLDPVESLRYE
ncbi:MAG TPA: ABC transporter permease [Terriglobales bacterium]|nr:ABC transporter permease [Terriglobales bacterium]